MIPLVDTSYRRIPRTKTDVYLAISHAIVRFAGSCELEMEITIPGASPRFVRRISRTIVQREGLPIIVEGGFGRVVLRRITGKHMRMTGRKEQSSCVLRQED